MHLCLLSARVPYCHTSILQFIMRFRCNSLTLIQRSNRLLATVEWQAEMPVAHLIVYVCGMSTTMRLLSQTEADADLINKYVARVWLCINMWPTLNDVHCAQLYWCVSISFLNIYFHEINNMSSSRKRVKKVYCYYKCIFVSHDLWDERQSTTVVRKM